MTRPILVFAPGAGAPSSSAWMQRYALLLDPLADVHRFDYTYMTEGRRAPDRLPRLIATHEAAVKEARRQYPDPGGARKVVLIGKSMGGRVGCHVSLTTPVAGLVCLGYPLQGAGKNKPLRDAVLTELSVPVLFVQGTRDTLCSLSALEGVRSRMKARSELHVVDSGNHSLEATRTWLTQNHQTQSDVDATIVRHVGAFCASL